MRAPIRLAGYVLLALAVAACGAVSGPASSPTPATSPSTSPTPSPSPTLTPSPTPTPTPLSSVAVYFVRNGKIAVVHRDVSRGDSVGALAALMSGPTVAERLLGLSTSIPAATRFLYVSWDGQDATVNLSKDYASGTGILSMSTRLAQVVLTVTQFAPIKYVSFQLDGKPVTVFSAEGILLDHPVTRATYESISPAILIESPGINETVTAPISVSGTANTFEAVFQLQLLNQSGQLLVARTIHASSGTGSRGTFAASLEPPAGYTGQAILRAFEYSAKDGSVINQVETPIVIIG